MDISKMCGESKEIQKKWEIKIGDFFYLPNEGDCIIIGEKVGFYIAYSYYIGNNIDIAPEAIKEWGTWLPTQDQLQEIWQKAYSKPGLYHLETRTWFGVFCEWVNKIYITTGLKETLHPSKHSNVMQELWLMFIMEKLYNKKWDYKTEKWRRRNK